MPSKVRFFYLDEKDQKIQNDFKFERRFIKDSERLSEEERVIASNLAREISFGERGALNELQVKLMNRYHLEKVNEGVNPMLNYVIPATISVSYLPIAIPAFAGFIAHRRNRQNSL